MIKNSILLPDSGALRMKPPVLLLLICLTPTQWVAAQDKPEQDAERAKHFQFMKRSVAGVEMKLKGGTKLTLKKEPLLRWANPVSGIKDGTVFVWTYEGRPHAAAQIFRVPSGTWLQEYQSLSPDGLTASSERNVFWKPEKRGIQMPSVKDAKPPRNSKALRLVQMKNIVRQFSAKELFEDREPYVLRLQSNPLLRYTSPKQKIVDGALFAFTNGTDPEVLVLVELTGTEESPEWQIGFAPLTSYSAEVRKQKSVVWKCPRRPPPNKASDGFYLRVLDEATTERLRKSEG